MEIKISKAEINDSAFVAKMILQSSRAGKKDGLFDLLFKTDDNEKVLQEIEKLVSAEAKSQCHYSNFLIAKVDKQPVGALCSYEPRIATKETFVKALNEIGYEDVNETLELIYSCGFDLNKRTLMFDFMEELGGFIDLGILKALMQKSLLNARLKGYTIVQTMIEIGSLEKELFYKKLGFKVVAQKECELYKEKFGRSGLMLLETEF